MTPDFEYDVAFSFNAIDEGIATQLNDLLSSRLKTFLYSERQREIAGTDGQESFSSVFGKTARIVVILFRPEWGETPWTRVECDAIKNRSLDEGWDFTLFVPTVERPQFPPWLPRTRLYVDRQRWGIDGVAAVIESRVAERGGVPREETIADRAARFNRAEQFKQLRHQFQMSDAGVRAANEAYEEFSAAIEGQATSVSGTGTRIETERSQHYRVITGLYPCNVVCSFRPYYANSIENVFLQVEIYKGFPNLPGYRGSPSPARKLVTRRYSYQLVRPDYHCWTAVDERDREFTPQQRADHVFGMYMDITEKTTAH